MDRRSFGWAAVALILFASTFPSAGQTEDKPDVTGAPAELNRRFVDPEVDVEQWVQMFEGESREVFDARLDVLRATRVAAGDRVADVGAGTGLYTRLFADVVGQSGWVHAVEISPAFLQHIHRTSVEAGLDNVTTVLGRVDSIGLPPESVDLVFLCDTYHHLEAVEPMLASIHRALAEGGRLVVIDFERIPGESREWVLDHVRAGKNDTRAEIEAAGFAFLEEIEIPAFAENYFITFTKKAGR